MLLLKALPYDDDALHVELYASNASFAAAQDFYCYPEDVRAFGERLSELPAHGQEEVVWEIGAPSAEWAYHVKLRVYLVDALGHSALEIFVDNHFISPARGVAAFSIPSEPASLNRLGRSLVAWSSDHSQPLEWKPAA